MNNAHRNPAFFNFPAGQLPTTRTPAQVQLCSTRSPRRVVKCGLADDVTMKVLRTIFTAPPTSQVVAPSVSSDEQKWTRLAICIVIDLIGSGGLGFPVLADVLDIGTAPLSALAVHALFGSVPFAAATLAEEILPGTDGIPSATLAWIAQQYSRSNATNANTIRHDSECEIESPFDVEVDAKRVF